MLAEIGGTVGMTEGDLQDTRIAEEGLRYVRAERAGAVERVQAARARLLAAEALLAEVEATERHAQDSAREFVREVLTRLAERPNVRRDYLNGLYAIFTPEAEAADAPSAARAPEPVNPVPPKKTSFWDKLFTLEKGADSSFKLFVVAEVAPTENAVSTVDASEETAAAASKPATTNPLSLLQQTAQ